MATFPVYVPASDCTDQVRAIAAGSGITSGLPDPSGMVLIYFEGNLYNSQNLRRYGERVHCAVGRLKQSYPTAAMMLARPDDLVEIGYFDDYHGVVHVTGDEALLRSWLGLDPEADLGSELPASGYQFEMRRLGLDPDKPLAAQAARIAALRARSRSPQ